MTASASTPYISERPLLFPPFFLHSSVQPPKIAGAFSTFLNGHSVPVAGTGLEKMPLIPINITVDGWIAWEDQWRSGKMHVNCPCLLRSGYSGAYALGQACTVKVDRDALKT
ncbi:unnamed protein product [Cuscuta europaea]|uniref:Uncharacterized protein n=1 Tax=Cuscuta europaea TaxID=41803 RepID=A0A9P1EFE8_CUSEU|nr:unnamed protein product [Cuscuta europaea]